jgi:sirohydrochlorin cobaltochelatase
MTNLLLHRARAIAPDVDPGNASLIIVGHGTSLNENSGLAVNRQVARIRACNQYAQVLGMFIEEYPFVTDWRKQTSSPHVIVVPFFVSDGLHSYQDIPVLLGIEPHRRAAAASAQVFHRNPYHIAGRRLYYSGAIGADPLFADVILDQVMHFDTRHPQLSHAA